MIKIKKNFIRLILEHYHLYASKSIKIPSKWVQLLQIHYSLINLSYIYNNSPTSWISFFVIFIRPAVALQLDYFQYIGVTFLILHLFYLVFPNFRGSGICSLINDLLKVSLLNFCFEQFYDVLGYIVGILLLIFQSFEQLFINWTLNIEIKNFQQVNITTLKVVKLLLDITLLVGYKTQLNYLIIQYLAILNSIIYAIYIFKENFQKVYISKIIIGIQMITIYLGIIQFIRFENSYTLIVAPFFFRIAQKINFNESLFIEQKDQIIISSIKLKERCYIECFKLLFSKKENNLLRDIKKQLIQQKCVEQYTCDLYKKNKIISFKGLAQQLQKNDMKKQKILYLLESAIQFKINIFENWNKSHYSDILKLIQLIDETKQYLTLFYNKQPYGAAKSASVYFYSEILNDIIETNEIITHTKKSLEIQSNFESNLSQVFYIQFNFQNNSLSINKASSNTPKKYITDQLSDLIPLGIQSCHNELVQDFIQTGQCKFAKNFNRNYINNDGFVESLNFALDLLYNNQIQFYSIIQPLQKQVDEYLIICDENHIIKSISKCVYENFTLHSIFKVGIKINTIIKQINEINSNCIIDSFRYYFQPISTSRKSFLFIDISEQAMNYFCDVIIEKKFIHNQLAYEIIELVNFRNYISLNQDAQSKQSKSKLSYVELETLNEIPKDEIVIPPYELFSEEPKNEAEHIYTSRDEVQIMLQSHNQTSNEYQKSVRSLRLFKTQIKDEPQNTKPKIDTQNDIYQQDSVSSSVQFLIQSKFIKKYSIINRFYKHKPLKNQQQFIISIFGLAIFIQIILILIQLSSLNLVQFATDIDLLEIKSLFFQPLDQFLATRWNLWTYNYQKQQGIITQTQYNEYSQFSISFLGRGYDTLNSNIQQVLDKTELQNILQTKQIQAFQQTSTYTYDLYNVNLRSAIQILLNFQYILKMNYVYEKTVKADSPQIFYSFKNYPILRDIIDQLNQDIMTATLLRGESYQNQLNYIFICQQVFLFVITASLILLKIRISKKLEVYFNILKFINQTTLEKEINKLKQILNKIRYLPEQIFNFEFKLYDKESQFFSKKTDLNPQIFHKFQKKYKISLKAFIFFLISFYCFIQLNCLFNYLEYMTYLKKYPQTASYKKQLSDLSGDIPLMFAQREVLYGRKNYMYLDENYFNKIFQYIQQSLNQTQEFTASDPNFSNMLMSDELINYYQKLQTNNLCTNLPDYLVNKSQILCPITMNGNMRQGLKAMLIYISNLISTDMSINNFVHREKPTQNELEGAYMVSEIILMLNKNFYNDLIEITTKLIQQIIIFNSLFMFGLAIVFIIIIIVVHNKMLRNSEKLLGLLYLIPEQILFNDEALERNLRILINI